MITTCTQHEWIAPDGGAFSYSAWGANLRVGQVPRAVVIAVHGLSGAALDYEPLGRHLVTHGIITFALELRGQGNDPVPKRRGDLSRLEDWFADLSAFCALVRGRHPDAQIYYYGESMGAALLTRFLAQGHAADLSAGLVLASPVIVVPEVPKWWMLLIFRFFLCVWPTYRLNFRKAIELEKDNPAKWVTRDEAHRRWFETAPHRLDSYTVRFFKCLFELIGGCMEAAPRIETPVLVIYAANDVFISPARVEKFFERLGSREKEIRLFPESYHLLLHDDDRAHALEQIETWLLRRIDVTDRERAAVGRHPAVSDEVPNSAAPTKS
jgi:acylglycerol lipase